MPLMWLLASYLSAFIILGGEGHSISPEVFDTLVHGFEGVVDIVCQ